MELAGDGLSELGKGRSIRELRHYGCVCHLNNPNKAFREGNFAQRIVQLISARFVTVVGFQTFLLSFLLLPGLIGAKASNCSPTTTYWIISVINATPYPKIAHSSIRWRAP